MIYKGTVNLYGGTIVGNKVENSSTSSTSGLYYGGGVYVLDQATFNLCGGSVSGNSSEYHGGGIYVGAGGAFNITSGTVSYNYNSGSYGGGVYVVGTTTMSGGTISNNLAFSGGPGLSVCGPFTMSGGYIKDNVGSSAGGGILIGENASVTMSGGEISGNQSTTGTGGGIAMTQATSVLTMLGDATITGNTASWGGGGVNFRTGTFNASGNATVTGNTLGNGTVANVNITSGLAINVVGDLNAVTYDQEDNTKMTNAIGVTYGNGTGIVAVGSGYSVTTGDKDKFTSDKGYYVITRNNDVQLVEALAGTGEDKLEVYSADPIDVSELDMFDFEFSETFGDFDEDDFVDATTTYSITEVTGKGTFDDSDNTLTVTSVGTFTVTVTTTLCDYAPPSTQTATLTVTPKEITVSGLTGVSRRYEEGNTYVTLTGGDFGEDDIIAGDDVSINYEEAYGTIGTNTGNTSDGYFSGSYDDFGTATETLAEYNVTVHNVTLTGSDAANYVVVDYNDTEVIINKDLPYISWPDAQDIIVGTASDDSQLLGGKVLVEVGDDESGTSTWYEINGTFSFVDTIDGAAVDLSNSNVGTYARAVKFTANETTTVADTAMTQDIWNSIKDSSITAITNRTHNVYQIVEPAEVEFEITVTGGTPVYTAYIAGTETTVAASNYTITTTTWSSNEDITLVNASFNNSNYRHAGTMESTGKQIGAYYTAGSGTQYTVSFYDDDDTSPTEYGSIEITDADPQDIHILPEYTGVVAWKTTWGGVSTTYEVGTRYPQPSRNVTFTAVYAETRTGDITGTVYGTDLDGVKYASDDNPSKGGLSDIGVTLMQGSEIIATAFTGADGTYTLSSIPYGKYNIVFTRDFGTKTEVTIFVEVDGDETVTPTLADATTDNSILYIAEGMTAITVKDFNDAIADASSRLSITAVDTDTSNAMIAGAETTSDSLKLFYNIDLTKPNDSGDYESTNATSNITYYIPLAGIYQGKTNYNVYYMPAGGGTVTPLTSGTGYSINDDLLTLTVSQSGIYGLSFENTTTEKIELSASKSIEYTKSPIATADLFAKDNDNVDIDLGDGETYTITDKDGVATTDATIDAATGAVSVTKIGTYTITVTTVATETAPSKIYTATLTVTAKEITISDIAAYPQATVYNDYAGLVTLDEYGVISDLESGDAVEIDWTNVVGKISYTTAGDENGYWDNSDLNTNDYHEFTVAITGLAITGADAGNYTLSNDTLTTTVLVYQDSAYFSWPTATEVVYGTPRSNGTEANDYTDGDLYGGKVMVEKTDIQDGAATVATEWVLLEGHFEWVGSDFTADNAGTQSYYVKFVEDVPTTAEYAGNTYESIEKAVEAYNAATYRNSVDTTTQLITQVVQKAQVQFTVAADGTVTAEDIDNLTNVDAKYFTPMWWLQETGASLLVGAENRPISGTAPNGYYLAYAQFDEVAGYTNYRHAGLSVSTGKQIGSFYLNTTPTTYTITFTVEEGDTAPTAITGAAEGDIHILPTLETTAIDANGEAYAKYSGWYDAATETTYAFGERFSQKDTNVTLTAILTPEKDATISGTVTGKDLDGTVSTELEKIAVTLMQGSQLIDYTETDAEGKYSFAVAAGSYNLDVTRDQFDIQNEMTVYVSVASGASVTKDFDIPNTTQNAELLVTTGDLDVVVEGLTSLTNLIADTENASSTTIRLEISDETNINTDRDEEPDYLKLIRATADANDHNDDNNNFKLFVDLDLTKIVDGMSEALTVLPADTNGDQQTLTFYIPLAGIHQGYESYYVYRYHDGSVDILYEKGTSKADSTEYIQLIGTDMLAVTAYKFSLYGVAYDDDTTSSGNNYYRPTTTTTTTTTTGTELNREDHNIYMYGYPDGSFSPSGNITRAETTVMFSRLMVATMEEGVSYENSFTDVGDDLWYYENIGFMEDFGIVTGYTDGSFDGGNYITRAEFATIACRFDDLSSEADCPFTDVGDHWAASYITAAAEKGWITGYEDGTFAPDQYITRAEAVTLVNRMLERYCDEDYIESNPDTIATFIDLDNGHWAYYQIMEATHSHSYTKSEDGTSETWEEISLHARSLVEETE